MEHAILHETIDGQRVDFYPETGFDDVMETDGQDAVTLRMVLQGIRNDIADEAQARAEAVSDEAGARQRADAALQQNIDTKAAKATTLSGYGITNAYTKTETNNLLNNKADTTNVYTKTEANNLLNQKIAISQGIDNKGKVLQVGSDGNVILSSGGGHKVVNTLPSVSSAEENVVYFVTSENMKGYIKNGNQLVPIGGNNGIPVGTILPWFLNVDVPVGFIRVLDIWYDSATYPTLDAMYGDTYGRQNGKFRLPPVWDNRFLEGSNIAGTLKDAGLPNIEGYRNVRFGGEDNKNALDLYGGAFYARAVAYPETTNAGSYQNIGTGFGFDASRSNPIYGNSNTVQPKAITVVWIIKAFEGASASSTDLEITNVANDLLKLRKDVDDTVKLVDKGRSSDGTIWYRKWSDGWLEQGGYGVSGDGGAGLQVNLVKSFTNTNYNILATTNGAIGGGSYLVPHYNQETVTVNGFLLFASNGGTWHSCGISWYTCGQGGND